MKNVRNLLKNIQEFQDFYSKRAIQMIDAKGSIGSNQSIDFHDIEFYADSVWFNFREVTPHDCPDYYDCTLTIEQLEMSDEEWEEVISSLANETIERRKKLKAVAEKAKEELERKELARLKEKFKD